MDREITITVSDEEARLIQERVDSGRAESPADFVMMAVRTELIGDSLMDAMIDDESLKALIGEALEDPRPDLSSEQVHKHLLDLYERALMAQVASEIDEALDDPTPRTSLEDTFAELRGSIAAEKSPRAKSAG
jgi:Arc/MetJ-type ribon-helix-helix transcriptional regulator